MGYYFIKVVLSAVTIVVVAEVAKRSSLLGAFVASLPLTSILAMIWLYLDTKDIGKVADLSYGILLIVIPSLLFFISFPWLVKLGWSFWPSMCASLVITAVSYWGYVQLLSKLNVQI